MNSRADDDFSFLRLGESFPLYLRRGPWSPFAIIFLLGILMFILGTFDEALKSLEQIVHEEPAGGDLIQYYRIIVSLYSLLVFVAATISIGYWPNVTYTFWSWNIMTARLILSYFSRYYSNSFCKIIAIALRFPSLVGCTITVFVWWLILVPVIHHHLSVKKRQQFWNFNTSFVLINVHGVNLLFSSVEFILCKTSLVFFDFWMGITIGYIYIIFYLFYLDAKGIHLYIVFSPRTHYCILSYSLLVLMYFGTYKLWNGILAWCWDVI